MSHAPTVFEFAGLLQGHGVDMGDPERRLAKARSLLEAGLCVEDAELVFAHVEATSEAGKAPRVVAALALDPKRLREAIVDARAFRDAQAVRAKARAGEDRAFGDKPYVPGPTEGESREDWDHDRQCRVAKCRHDGDRLPMAALARELGVSETTAELMVARGRVLDQSGMTRPKVDSPAKIEKAERSGEKRVADFRERMAIDRKQRERQGGRKPFDWDRMHREEGKILARLRSTGNVDLAEILRDPCKRGALATLEADGHILRAEAPDTNQCQRYLVARDDAERAQFVERRRAWDQADMGKPRRRAHAGGVE
jgi:hypothetical protein